MSPQALRFMVGFECIGPLCEDTCCANWRIDVDRRHFIKISRLLRRTPEGEAELARAFSIPPEADQSPGRYVSMNLSDEGYCPFLSADKLCSIHQRFTERMLPDVCGHFPRSISVVGGQMELTGQLSCPEVARRALADEHACDLVEVDEINFARGGTRQRTYLDSGDPYYDHFLEARETVLGILSLRQYPMRSRLFFLLAFADRTSGFFHRSTQNFDAEAWDEERRAMRDPAVLDELHGELEKVELPDGMPLFVIAQVLSGDVRLRSGGRFRQVVTDVLESYSAAFDAREVSAAELWSAYRPRRDERMARSAARIDQFFENYCKQFWVRDWYVDFVTLYQYAQALVVRVAVLRFLLLSLPASADPETLQRAAVDVFASMARGVEHHNEFLKLITEGLQALMPTVLHAAALLWV
jgi:lysine-N-methylase